MKKIYLTIFILNVYFSIFAQSELVDRVTTQAIEIDSLKKVILSEKENLSNLQLRTQQLQSTIKIQTDSLKILRNDISQLVKLRNDLNEKDIQLKSKNDSILLLKSMVSDLEKQMKINNQNSIIKIKEEKENGKNEILQGIEKTYINKSFDDVLKFSNKESVERDLELLGQASESKALLLDLINYFSFEELLIKKVDMDQINQAQYQLSEIEHESTALENLKEKIDNYQIFSEGIKETIEKIIILDQTETVAGMPDNIQNQKLNKILSEISLYIFNYDFKLKDFPFLSELIFEILKRKQPNPDADISDLLNKL